MIRSSVGNKGLAFTVTLRNTYERHVLVIGAFFMYLSMRKCAKVPLTILHPVQFPSIQFVT